MCGSCLEFEAYINVICSLYRYVYLNYASLSFFLRPDREPSLKAKSRTLLQADPNARPGSPMIFLACRPSLCQGKRNTWPVPIAIHISASVISNPNTFHHTYSPRPCSLKQKIIIIQDSQIAARLTRRDAGIGISIQQEVKKNPSKQEIFVKMEFVICWLIFVNVWVSFSSNQPASRHRQ